MRKGVGWGGVHRQGIKANLEGLHPGIRDWSAPGIPCLQLLLALRQKKETFSLPTLLGHRVLDTCLIIQSLDGPAPWPDCKDCIGSLEPNSQNDSSRRDYKELRAMGAVLLSCFPQVLVGLISKLRETQIWGALRRQLVCA